MSLRRPRERWEASCARIRQRAARTLLCLLVALARLGGRIQGQVLDDIGGCPGMKSFDSGSWNHTRTDRGWTGAGTLEQPSLLERLRQHIVRFVNPSLIPSGIETPPASSALSSRLAGPLQVPRGRALVASNIPPVGPAGPDRVRRSIRPMHPRDPMIEHPAPCRPGVAAASSRGGWSSPRDRPLQRAQGSRTDGSGWR